MTILKTNSETDKQIRTEALKLFKIVKIAVPRSQQSVISVARKNLPQLKNKIVILGTQINPLQFKIKVKKLHL